MPWGTLILGAFLCGGVTLMFQHFIVGTTATDELVKTGVPLALVAIFVMLLVFGTFGGKN